MAATAGGRRLGPEGRQLRLRRKDLAPVLEEFAALPEAERTPELEPEGTATPPRRPVPDPPPNGLIVRAYCTYLAAGEDGRVERARRFYYERNPDRWVAETQSDMLWLTEAEWRALIPDKSAPGARAEVPAEVQRRFFSTVGIDFMEGSVNSLPPRDTAMTVTVEAADEGGLDLRLEGRGHLGVAFGEHERDAARSRGCAVRVRGRLRYDRAADRIVRFDLAGTGRAWGNKMNYTRREIALHDYPWLYGVAAELVTGEAPADRIPPYNLLHYDSAGSYFARAKE